MNDKKLESMMLDNGFSIEVCHKLLDFFSQEDNGNGFNLILKNVGPGISVIKNSDFPLLESSATIAAGMLGGAIAEWAPAAVAGLIFLLFKYRKKRIMLDGIQAAIILELEYFRGLTSQQLTNGFGGIFSLEEIEHELENLSQFKVNDDKVITLIWKDGESKWRLQDL